MCAGCSSSTSRPTTPRSATPCSTWIGTSRSFEKSASTPSPRRRRRRSGAPAPGSGSPRLPEHPRNRPQQPPGGQGGDERRVHREKPGIVGRRVRSPRRQSPDSRRMRVPAPGRRARRETGPRARFRVPGRRGKARGRRARPHLLRGSRRSGPTESEKPTAGRASRSSPAGCRSGRRRRSRGRRPARGSRR